MTTTNEAIFEKLKPTTERAVKTREELFAKLKQELDVHAHIEETILYPEIKNAAETHDITLEGYEEHHVIDVLLKELAVMPVGTEEWGAKLKVLKENFEHHIEEERRNDSKRGDILVRTIEELGAGWTEKRKRCLSASRIERLASNTKAGRNVGRAGSKL